MQTVTNTMLRFFIIISILFSAAASSNEGYKKWKCTHNGKEYVSSISTVKIIKNGVIFNNVFYENLRPICKVKQKGLISITYFEEASPTLIERYVTQLKKCGWDILPQEKVADESLF